VPVAKYLVPDGLLRFVGRDAVVCCLWPIWRFGWRRLSVALSREALGGIVSEIRSLTHGG